ncbi:serine/threonine-protein kinase [Neochlamydia sp. S13]|uniref:serine/threonine protein kinase n=1 Tax=Neochlamydia sp. S13 TaxID=1353976 RepID=UPI000693B0AF|nr:serine/threonine-protein kinase [Neochlamydia sp. S13]BBI17860.1 Putative serine/threonine protein kinase [Neochlamydia sp. S13]
MTASESHQRPTLPAAPSDKESFLSLPLPKKIGPYKIEALLEKGGMSILYLGTHPETNEPTTIKVLSPKFVSNPEIVERFLKEAEIIALADHPNIVKLYGQGKWAGGLYIAMEFIQGISLRQYILQTPISLRRALEIIIDISYALCHLHTHGVIHRDLKPENILVTESDVIKVIDFGIAQLLKESSSDISKQPRMIGTPIYMSPEQQQHPDSVSFPSDIYSLGIIAYELMLGKLSQGHIHLSLMPKGMQKILVKALQPEVRDRYQDIVDFIAAVSGYLNSESFEKDKIVKDYLSELSESLRRTQAVLSHDKAPQWNGVHVKVTASNTHAIAGVYYDFLEINPGSYGIAFAESSLNYSDGMVVCSIFRGMLKALYKRVTDLKELAYLLNQLIIEDGLDKSLKFNYLTIDTQQNKVQYLICGHSYLWARPHHKTPFKVICENPPLGSDPHSQFQIQQVDWKSNDSYILSNTNLEMSEKELLEIWQSAEKLNPPLWMEIFLRRKRAMHKILSEKAITFIAIQSLA